MKILLSALLTLPLLAVSGAALADHGQGHGHGPKHDGYHDQGWHGHGHHWQRGERYDGPVVIVRDYEEYHLRTPPRGYHWVRDDDNNYVLVAIATGIILDAILN